MIDINSRAIDLAKQNAERNKVEATIFQSNIYENVTGSFDYIISNHLSVLGRRWFIKLLRRHMIISIKVVT